MKCLELAGMTIYGLEWPSKGRQWLSSPLFIGHSPVLPSGGFGPQSVVNFIFSRIFLLCFAFVPLPVARNRSGRNIRRPKKHFVGSTCRCDSGWPLGVSGCALCQYTVRRWGALSIELGIYLRLLYIFAIFLIIVSFLCIFHLHVICFCLDFVFLTLSFLFIFLSCVFTHRSFNVHSSVSHSVDASGCLPLCMYLSL